MAGIPLLNGISENSDVSNEKRVSKTEWGLRCDIRLYVVYNTIVSYNSPKDKGGYLFRPRRKVRGTPVPAINDWRCLMLHEFTPQEVFLVVFSGIVFAAFIVNRLHSVNVIRNKNELH